MHSPITVTVPLKLENEPGSRVKRNWFTVPATADSLVTARVFNDTCMLTVFSVYDDEKLRNRSGGVAW